MGFYHHFWIITSIYGYNYGIFLSTFTLCEARHGIFSKFCMMNVMLLWLVCYFWFHNFLCVFWCLECQQKKTCALLVYVFRSVCVFLCESKFFSIAPFIAFSSKFASSFRFLLILLKKWEWEPDMLSSVEEVLLKRRYWLLVACGC